MSKQKQRIMETLEKKQQLSATAVLNAQTLLDHWQGHRRITRRLIEAYPEDKLFSYSIGGMRTCGDLIKEILTMSAPGIRGVVAGTWPSYGEVQKSVNVSTKKDLLLLWDESTAEINELWPKITAERFQETDKFFGQYEGAIWWSIMYVIDNEIHHRAQAYVYLRSLGIEPPAFWDRS
jgi:uncharacterized damage-inducible protein DinB